MRVNQAELILKMASIIVWPAAAFGAMFLFRRPLGDLISRVHTVTSKVANVSFTEIEQVRLNLPSPTVEPPSAARNIHQALKLPPKSVEKVVPSFHSEVSELSHAASTQVLQPSIEAAWERLVSELEQHRGAHPSNPQASLTSLLEAPEVLSALSKLAEVRKNLSKGAVSLDASTATAFSHTVEQIIFILQDQQPLDSGDR
jgi:hypothetical protein